MVEFLSGDLWTGPGFKETSTDNNKSYLQILGQFLYFRVVNAKNIRFLCNVMWWIWSNKF